MSILDQAPPTTTAPPLTTRSRNAEVGIVERAIDVLERTATGEPHVISGIRCGDADLEAVLRQAIADQTERLEAADPRDDVSPADRARLVAELQQVYLDLREMHLSRRIEAHDWAQEGLERLRNVNDPQTLLDRVTRELCTSCGFERGVLSRIDGSEWILSGAHFTGDESWAEDFVRLGQQTRPVLTHTMLETHMARRRAPALVTDAMNDPHTHKPFVQHSRTACYVGAPIMPRGRVVGFFHADHHFSGRPVDEMDRDSLWVFAAGFAYVYERAVLLHRLREQRSRIEQMVSSTSTLVDALCDSDVDDERLTRNRAVLRGRSAALTAGSQDNPMLLTPREVEVLSLMAAGATNAVIAQQLFISEGTVKSHVKRILRKLNASNRAEAVSRYLRSKAEQRGATGMPLAG